MSKIVLACLLGACAAAAQPNFSGVWQSDASPDTMAKIEQTGPKFDFTMRAPGRTVALHAVAGQETKNDVGGLSTLATAEWDGDTFVLHLQATNGANAFNVTDRFTLMEGGAKLQVDESRKVTGQPDAGNKTLLARKPAADWERDLGLEPADKIYKNIQALHGHSAKEVREFMERITKALGVGCLNCHSEHFESDEKPAKVTARKMMLMVKAIDTQNFPSSNAVTCWTCHRGSLKPQSAPPPPAAAPSQK